MVKREKASRQKRLREKWFLYILECKGGSLYTGITKDLTRRLKMHNSGQASHYTSARRPVKLLYQESCAGRVQALVRECEVKSFSRHEKEELILTKKV
ncbi:MAG: GIY-YIG nuclease family protein [Candidatus Omnitrophica bacterium]|nr:GIY-YIG nuclease family protein [Candidatus Omnitrophota bacterium]